MDLEIAFQDSGIVKKGHFPLRSGKHSDTYVHKDLLFCDPALFLQVVKGITGMYLTKCPFCNFVTGPPMSGAMLAAATAFYLEKGFAFPEKIGGGLIAFRRGFGPFLSKKSVLLIEDVTTTGGSILRTVKAIQKHGGYIAAVIVLWNRGNVQSKEYPIHSLINREIPSWEPKDCPLCKQGISLDNPKI